MTRLLKIDLSRLATVEQTKDKDRALWEEAKAAASQVALSIRERNRQLQSLEDAHKTHAHNRTYVGEAYETRKRLTVEIEQLIPQLRKAEGDRDAATERMQASLQLWENCARYAGVRA
ncbi:MAG: hypothetical protein KJ947_11580 [Alphaproteobacteria bacterium]|nr:hypothetical protein [Alphaproteobacteria bacterium]MBU1550197.1 hypothetical protein [Alphaproteobacteria bacterium]MBU2337882.1 hypothetical protein [Alphaproteobacteria bacterium]MBU2387862.1 hypothetical protein [Alphaproteobacteria bacterium]